MAELSGRARGGKAAADKMTIEQRRERAMKGVEARKANSELPKATHPGHLKIGNIELDCVVLEDGTRLFTRTSFLKAIGRTGKAKGGRAYDDEFNLPVFLTANNIKPFIPEELYRNSAPVFFKNLNSTKSIGYKAELLPQVCGVFMDAEKFLNPNQIHIAEQCKILIRGFATVGIIALVDEVTGYQDIRARDELNIILQSYIAKELLPWTKKFPDEFYKQIFRLHSWPFNPMSVRRPGYVGKLTNQLVYERLPEGVLEELKNINPPNESGNRRHRHHQFLTESIGHPHLEKHIASVTTLMRVSDSWDGFKSIFIKAFPVSGDQHPLFEDESE